MEVGTHVDGRSLTYDAQTGRFFVGDTTVTSEQVRACVDAGQIRWASDETRTWFHHKFQVGTGTVQTPPAARESRLSEQTRRTAAVLSFVIAVTNLTVMGVFGSLDHLGVHLGDSVPYAFYCGLLATVPVSFGLGLIGLSGPRRAFALVGVIVSASLMAIPILFEVFCLVMMVIDGRSPM